MRAFSTYFSTNCLLFIHKKNDFGYGCSNVGWGHICFLHSNADMAMGGRPFNTFFNLPNIRSSSIRMYIYDHRYNNQCTCFNNPAQYSHARKHVFELHVTNRLPPYLYKFSWVKIRLQKLVTLYIHPHNNHDIKRNPYTLLL